jgi:hypothetical protein
MSVNATSEHFLAQVERLVDWAPLASLIAAVGCRLDADVPMTAVKLRLLARWYGLDGALLLEACQDRISFRRFLGLPFDDGDTAAATLAAALRQQTQAPLEMQQLVDAVEAQLLGQGYAVRPGGSAEAAIVRVSPPQPGTSETAFFQPGELADLLRQGESLLARGGAKVATTPPYQAGPVELTPPPQREIAPLQAVIEWPWGTTTELTQRVTVGREVGFSQFAPELEPYLHVSRRHAELMPCPEGVWLRDLRSRNGTFVNGDEIPKGQAYLVDTDARIRFGPYCVAQLRLKH